MKVIIVGSGLVGAATAIALTRAGHECTLYDQADLKEAAAKSAPGRPVFLDFGESGGSVMLRSNSLRMIRSLGLLDEVLENSSPNYVTHFQKIDGSAAIVHQTFEEAARIETEKDLAAPRQIMRSKLHSIFVIAAQKAGVKMFVNRKVIKVEQTANSVSVRFQNGGGATADLLVGSDGIHSAVRRQIFGEDSLAKFTGQVGYIAVVNLLETGIKLDQTCAFFIDRMKKRLVCTFKVSEKFAAVQVMTYTDPDPEEDANYRPYSDLPKHSTRLADLIARWGVPENVVEMMRKAFRISPASLYDLPDLASYHKGRVVLVGDSAHGMLPNAGLGLGAGLEDVGVLDELLRLFPDTENVNNVLAMYSRLRVPMGTMYSNNSRQMADVFYMSSLGSSGSHFLLRMFVWALNKNLYQPVKEVYDSKKAVQILLNGEKNSMERQETPLEKK
ncbi:hypothetical protein HDU83_004528 [Entophlyctis luteolus]|nr:hypothetical protein HDU83_004528 [Entophlyctis luteolus]